MTKLKRGITTSETFAKVLKERVPEATVEPSMTAEALLDVFKEIDEDITFESNDDEILEAVNGEQPTPPTPATLVSIEVTTPPTKTEYVEGDTFDPTGMVVTGTYSDGETKAETDYTFAPSDALATTDTTITITVGEKTTTTAITVTEAPATLESIEVTTAPTKTSYSVGETFDATGMVVTGTYSDGSTKEETEYTYSPDGALELADTEITVTVQDKTATTPITVTGE